MFGFLIPSAGHRCPSCFLQQRLPASTKCTTAGKYVFRIIYTVLWVCAGLLYVNPFFESFNSSSRTTTFPQTTQGSGIQGCGSAPAQCIKSRYRSYDGSCNNLVNPSWGTTQSRYNRLLPQKYGDGKSILKSIYVSRSNLVIP